MYLLRNYTGARSAPLELCNTAEATAAAAAPTAAGPPAAAGPAAASVSISF